jgi:hypothetical protein
VLRGKLPDLIEISNDAVLVFEESALLARQVSEPRAVQNTRRNIILPHTIGREPKEIHTITSELTRGVIIDP